MDNNTYVKLEYPELVSLRRDTLSCEANFLVLLRKLRNYKELRRMELSLKSKLGTTVRKIKSEVNATLSHLPKAPYPQIKHFHAKKQTQKQKTIEDQLKEIREKLARLS